MNLTTLRKVLSSPHTTNQKIFRAATVVTFFNIFVTVAMVARELVIARQFGRADVLDAFLIAYLLPSFMMSLIGGAVHAALIPTFIQVREKEGHEASVRLISSVTVGSLCMLLMVAGALGLFAPYYLPLLASGFGPAKIALTRNLIYELLPYLIASGMIAIWTAILNSVDSFGLPAFTPIITPIGVILLVILLGRSWGIGTLVMGTVCGVYLEASLLGVALWRSGFRLRLRWYGLDSNVREVIKQFAPMIGGTLLMGGANIVDQSMAAMLGPGSVAALGYGRRVISGVLQLGAVGLNNAILPFFSRMATRRDWSGCRHSLRRYTGLVLMLSIPVTIGIFLFSSPIVKLVFQRGAFTTADTKMVARVQALYSLQIPFYVGGTLFVRLLSALKHNEWLLWGSGINLLLDVILNLVFMRYLGVSGIALSTSMVFMASFSFLGICVFRLLPRADNGVR